MAPPAGGQAGARPQPDSHVWRRAVQTPLDDDRACGPVSYPQVFQPGQVSDLSFIGSNAQHLIPSILSLFKWTFYCILKKSLKILTP